MAQFKTRARALDLLGRQQIAGIPTAINELIKNAHDAYADHFDIDFLRKDNMLVLRDDGIGMSKKDFLERWLTLGTDSKVQGKSNALPPVDPTKPQRPIMGEKGIGRLAIASIGSQVLILTKAKYESSSKVVAAFICWDVFELTGINIDDVVIPVREFIDVPSNDEVDSLKYECINSLKELYETGNVSESDFSRITCLIENFNSHLDNVYSVIGGNTFLQEGGTHFFIAPVSDSLIPDIEGDGDSSEATKMEKMLMGFHNTMTPNHPAPTIDIAFRDFRNDDGTFVSLLEEKQFFTSDEFEIADHHFSGQFDEFGQFKGTIRIYGEKTYNHIINWRDNHYRETECGPFTINLAYLQGELKSSRVDVENYGIIRRKGDKYGGLYIYRNNIRILPYGDSDYDFLDIEKNRSKRASTYFFSYRRMFGAIEIADGQHSKLIEKAGREGFIENKAYRQLQSILKNFFWQLAADFFNEKGNTPQSEFYNVRKSEINSYYQALERRDKLAKGKKDKFIQELERFFARLSGHQFEQDCDSIISQFRNELSALIYTKDSDAASQRLIDSEMRTRQILTEYRRKISINPPKGFAMTKSMRIDYDSYLEEFRILDESIFKPHFEQIDSLVDEFTECLKLEINKRKRLEQAVDLISKDALSSNKQKKDETNDVVGRVSKRIKDLTNDLILDLDNQIREVKDQFKLLSTKDDFNLVSERMTMEKQIDAISQRNTDVMDRIIRQFESFYVEKSEDGQIITNDQIAEATSEELEVLRERLQTDVELSQLGLAVGIVHHEFNGTINSIRHSINDLRVWSEVNENLEKVYKNIKINFEHLDGYLNLFTPLNRRLNRRREEISLLDIKTFLIDLFKARLERHHIAFKHTNGFARHKLFGFRSTFYPVFVNIIDNAIYWLKQSDIPEKVIRLHADDTGIYISNNGLSIKPQDKERIFEMHFSRKINGRGMGLSISREVLEAEGYSLILDEPRENSTVTFKIIKK